MRSEILLINSGSVKSGMKMRSEILLIYSREEKRYEISKEKDREKTAQYNPYFCHGLWNAAGNGHNSESRG